MNSADAAIIRNIRRELSKRPIECGRIDIQVVNGRVTLNGMVQHLRDKPDVDIKSEMDHVQKMVMRDRDVKEVSINVRIMEDQTPKEDTDSRGRMRH